MGEITIPRPVKFICGLLASDTAWLRKAHKLLSQEFGPIDLKSEIVPFNFTRYYEAEMGGEIKRQYVCFEKLRDPGKLAQAKLNTNHLEEGLSVESSRRFNLDPGYVDLSKMVLATTKDATYRVYLGDGIYAQSTLFFRKGGFQPWEWTYPDYRSQAAIAFFNRVREVYRQQLRG